MTQKDNEYEEIYLAATIISSLRSVARLSQMVTKSRAMKHKMLKYFLNKAVQNERWDIVRDCSRLIQRQNSFQMRCFQK